MRYANGAGIVKSGISVLKKLDPESAMGWNPRYVAYATAHNRSPEAMLEHDEAWPGGQMAGFMLWVNTHWIAWRKLRGLHRDFPLSVADYADFDSWIKDAPDLRSAAPS